MKIRQLFRRVDARPALFFLVLSSVWILLTHRVFKHDLISEIILVVGTTILVYFYVKALAKQLIRVREEYKNLFDTHPSPMWIYDKDSFRFVTVNLAAIRLYGYSKHEFLAMTILDIRPTEDVGAFKQFSADPANNCEKESTWRHLKKNGDEIMARIMANDVTFNKRTARLIQVTDITQSLVQEKEIRQMSLVVENATNGVILSDASGCIKWVNKAFERTTGYTLAEVKGKYPRSFLHGPETDKNVEALIVELAAQQKCFSGDIINYKKNGEAYWVHLSLSPVVRNGVTENIVVIQTDINELKEQSEKISDQYRRFRNLAFMVSHNARSQLTNIIGLCDAIDHQSSDSEQKKMTGYLKQSASKLDEVIHSIILQTSVMESENVQVSTMDAHKTRKLYRESEIDNPGCIPLRRKTNLLIQYY